MHVVYRKRDGIKVLLQGESAHVPQIGSRVRIENGNYTVTATVTMPTAEEAAYVRSTLREVVYVELAEIVIPDRVKVIEEVEPPSRNWWDRAFSR